MFRIYFTYLLVGSIFAPEFKMTTRESIIKIADQLIREKGFNAFSFKDISNTIGIKTASIHYHFPSKTDLGLAAVRKNMAELEKLKNRVKDKSPSEKLEGYLSIYSKMKSENSVCVVGSLATDLHTVDEAIRNELKLLAGIILEWVTDILAEGKRKKVFVFKGSAEHRALMVVTNMLAILQLSRLTKPGTFDIVKKTIISDLKG